MNKSLSEIIKNRKSVRAYLDKSVSNDLIKENSVSFEEFLYSIELN